MGRLFMFCVAFWSIWALALTSVTIPSVVVEKAKLQEISHTLTYPAEVAAKVQATVLADTDGVVRKIRVHLGQHVKAGGHLMIVQQRDPIFRYAPVAAVTPVAGIVSSLDVTEGALISKGQKLAEVIDPANLKVTVEIPAGDLSLMQNEKSGMLELPTLTKPLNVDVVGISPNVDPATGTATAELKPAPHDISQLRPGMIGKVTFKADLHKGFLVPEDALVESQQKTFLRLVTNGVSKEIPVTVGNRIRGYAEVTQGLHEGDQVIERASGFVADGAKVKVEGTTN